MTPSGAIQSPPQRRSQAYLAAAPLAVLLGASLLACGERPAPQWPADETLVIALEGSPRNLDPRLATDQSSQKVLQLAANGLVTKDPEGNLIPDLAESWEVLDEGRRYRFYLRDGVRFHDGRELTSEDVVWTFGTIVDGTVVSSKRAAFAVVERLEAVDPRTVDFVLSEPFGALLADLTPGTGIIPAGTTPEESNEAFIGTGPFRLVQRNPERLVLEAFDQAWQGRPKLDRVVLKEVPDATVRALELLKGSVQLVVNDLAADVVPQFRQSRYFQVVEKPGANYAYLGLNLEDPVLKDRRVRRAFAMSIDRQRLVDTLWSRLGTVGETMLPPGLWARHPDLPPIPHDPVGAAALLEEAGYPDPDGDGPEPRIRLTYKTSTNEPYLLQAQVIQAMAAEAGIGITVRSLEFATLYADVTRGSFQIFGMIRTGIIEPNIYRMILHSEAVPPRGQNRGKYNNPEFDRMIEEGARLTDPQARLPFYLKAQEIFAQDLPYISLYTRINYGVLPVTLQGYESYPSGELLSVRNMYWDRSALPTGP